MNFFFNLYGPNDLEILQHSLKSSIHSSMENRERNNNCTKYSPLKWVERSNGGHYSTCFSLLEGNVLKNRTAKRKAKFTIRWKLWTLQKSRCRYMTMCWWAKSLEMVNYSRKSTDAVSPMENAAVRNGLWIQCKIPVLKDCSRKSFSIYILPFF